MDGFSTRCSTQTNASIFKRPDSQGALKAVWAFTLFTTMIPSASTPSLHNTPVSYGWELNLELPRRKKQLPDSLYSPRLYLNGQGYFLSFRGPPMAPHSGYNKGLPLCNKTGYLPVYFGICLILCFHRLWQSFSLANFLPRFNFSSSSFTFPRTSST